MEVCLGYIMGYHPENATVDIRTIDGTPYNALPFDANLAFYSTPVLPIFRTDPITNAVTTVKMGSFVLLAKFSDSNIRIIRIFNDDQDLVQNYPGRNTRSVHGFVQDTLIAMMQDGEALISAPGRIIETTPNRFERQAGAWMLFKNSGDAILSNADSSCELWVSHDGKFEANTTKFRLKGLNTLIQEDDAGVLTLSSGTSAAIPVTLVMDAEVGAQLTNGDSTMLLSTTDYSVSAGVVNIGGGNAITLTTPQCTIAAGITDVVGDEISLDATSGITAAANTLDLVAYDTAGISAGTTGTIAANDLVVNAGNTVSITVPKTAFAMGPTGATITLDKSVTLTILVGSNSIVVSDSGIILAATPAKPLKIGDQTASIPVIIGTAPGAWGAPSTVMLVSS